MVKPTEQVRRASPEESPVSNGDILTAARLALIVSAVIAAVFYFDLSGDGRSSGGVLDLSGFFLILLAGASAGFGLVIALLVVSMKLGTSAGRIAGLAGGLPPTALYLILRSGQSYGNRALPLSAMMIALCAIYGYSALGGWLGRPKSR